MHWKYPIEVNNLSVGWFLFATWIVNKWLFFEMTFQIISDKNLNNLKICWSNQVNSYLVRSFGFNQFVPNALFLLEMILTTFFIDFYRGFRLNSSFDYWYERLLFCPFCNNVPHVRTLSNIYHGTFFQIYFRKEIHQLVPTYAC